MYIETDKKISDSFSEELKNAGFPQTFSIGTRRLEGSVVKKYQPRAMFLPIPERKRKEAQALIDNHVPNFGNVARKIQEVKAEASRQILEILPVWKQVREARKGTSAAEFAIIDKIAESSNDVEAHILTLTDEEAGAFDVQKSNLWRR